MFNMNLAGHIIRGPNDGGNGNYAWMDFRNYTRDVYGNGPFVISVDAADYGVRMY